MDLLELVWVLACRLGRNQRDLMMSFFIAGMNSIVIELWWYTNEFMAL